MPFFNSERFIAEAIESVLAQSLTAFELLLVHDGSTDGSSAIASAYRRKLPDKIRCIEHPGRANRGIQASRALGLKHSKGEFIARVDSDDVLRPEAFEEQVALMRRYPKVAMTYGPVEIWTSWAGGVDLVQPLTVPRNVSLLPPTVLRALLLDGRDEPCHVFIRRTALDAVGGYGGMDVFGQLYEDIALAVKICSRYPVIASDHGWCRYRQHPDSFCAVARGRNEMDQGCLSFLQWTAKYLQQQGSPDEGIEQVLERRIAAVKEHMATQ